MYYCCTKLHFNTLNSQFPPIFLLLKQNQNVDTEETVTVSFGCQGVRCDVS